jgi:hypothetical protein
MWRSVVSSWKGKEIQEYHGADIERKEWEEEKTFE